jgi:CheY-like chemotaxis protein
MMTMETSPQVLSEGDRHGMDLSSLRVLLVEDNPHTAKLVQSVLKGIGIKPSKLATDGHEALKALAEAESPINLVISDVRMPNMDGLALLRQMRADKIEIPFLIITGYADVATVKAAKLGRADALIAKPFSPEQLEQKLLAICRRLQG